MVRPWAIAGPVLVLLLAAPLIRPLFSPTGTTDPESMTLEAVRSVLRHHSLVLDPTRVRNAEAVYHNGTAFFATDAPVFSITLSGVGWVIERAGVSVEKNPVLFEYLLILFAITLPTALASGLIYRMARSFELPRWWRMLIAMASVLATGWFSYCVILMPHALAAALVTIAATSVWYVASAKKPMLAVGWLAGGGFCAALAAAIEPNAAWMLVLLPMVVLVLKQPARVRLIGLLLVIAGAAAPIVLHISVTTAITGDLLPPSLHASHLAPQMPVVAPYIGDDIEPIDASLWVAIGRGLNRLIVFTVGTHGIFSHFPVLVIAMTGLLMVLHRHWTGVLKWIAGGVLVAIVLQLIVRMTIRVDLTHLSFAAPSMVAMLPLLMLFSGAWLRRPHGGLVWTIAGIGLGVSVLITLIGATGPAPQDGFTGYTAAEAVERLFTKTDPAVGLTDLSLRSSRSFSSESMGIMVQAKTQTQLPRFLLDNTAFLPSAGSMFHFKASIQAMVCQHNSPVYAPGTTFKRGSTPRSWSTTSNWHFPPTASSPPTSRPPPAAKAGSIFFISRGEVAGAR